MISSDCDLGFRLFVVRTCQCRRIGRWDVAAVALFSHATIESTSRNDEILSDTVKVKEQHTVLIHDCDLN